jgi:hypothetical protein
MQISPILFAQVFPSVHWCMEASQDIATLYPFWEHQVRLATMAIAKGPEYDTSPLQMMW